MFKKPFSFKGMIRRLEYGLSYPIAYGIIFIIAFIGEFLSGLLFSGSSENIATLIIIPFAIAQYWFFLAQGVKRSHDIGNSGWYILIPFYSLYTLFADSQYGKNEYGPNPKGLGNTDEIEEIGQSENLN